MATGLSVHDGYKAGGSLRWGAGRLDVPSVTGLGPGHRPSSDILVLRQDHQVPDRHMRRAGEHEVDCIGDILRHYP